MAKKSKKPSNLGSIPNVVGTDFEVVSALNTVSNIYQKIPQTSCSQCTTCCKSGCPHMYWIEFINIRRLYVDKLDKKARLELTLKCIEKYISNDEIKPCVFLNDKDCALYKCRHLKCRLYGLYPNKIYEQMVDEEVKETGKARETIPLCQQCPNVKICSEEKEKYPEGCLTEKFIKSSEFALKALSKKLNAGKEDTPEYLTYHDWHMFFEFGPAWMEQLSQVRLKMDEKGKQDFLNQLRVTLTKQFGL